MDEPATLTDQDRADLEGAVELLERPSFIARVSAFIGKPIEQAVDFLPGGASEQIQSTVRTGLERLLAVSVRTLDPRARGPAATLKHTLGTGITGAIGGFFGAPALAVELPITTSILLRSIADVARSEGEDVLSVDTRLACLEVFALGGQSTSDDASETGYFAVRAALARAMSEAARHLAERGFAREGAPVVARLIAAIASRFGAVVSEKVAVQSVPILGAIGGASINMLFARHFQDMARGHFTVRRLERNHGPEVVRREYRRIVDGRPVGG
jgi:hypothetical protein